MIKARLKNTQGQGMSEYLILTFLVAVGAIAATHTLKTSITGKIGEIRTHISRMSLGDGGRGSGQGSGSGRNNGGGGRSGIGDILGGILN